MKKAVSGDDLIDRQEVVEEIVRNAKGGQSLILAAPRRYGKTSVILEAIS
jgi:AAA+ ATPase superfamily predicted ATPase